MPWMWIYDEDIEIEGVNPSMAFFEKFWKKLKRWNSKHSNIVLLTWKKRMCFTICD